MVTSVVGLDLSSIAKVKGGALLTIQDHHVLGFLGSPPLPGFEAALG
jgi:hypothetical protein